MFNGIKNRFKQLRYGDEKRRRKVFWISSVSIFLIIFVVWLLFFAGQSIKVSDKKTGQDFGSLWQAVTEKFNDIGTSLNNISTVINSTSTASSTESDTTTSTVETTSTSQ